MLPSKNFPECPVALTAGLIGNKWKLMILRDLFEGTKRFGELRKSLTPISQRILTQNLREMERDGLIMREVFAEVPPRVEYSLNGLGRSLSPVIKAMAEWGEGYKKKKLS